MKAGTRIGGALVAALACVALGAAIPAGASSAKAPAAKAAKSACTLSAAEQGDALGSSYTYSL